MVLGLGLISLFIAMMYSDTVNVFSLDSLFLSLRVNSQNLVVVKKPSVAKVIFLCISKSSSFDVANVAATDLFERLDIQICVC